jgi:hypothetical protein
MREDFGRAGEYIAWVWDYLRQKAKKTLAMRESRE